MLALLPGIADDMDYAFQAWPDAGVACARTSLDGGYWMATGRVPLA